MVSDGYFTVEFVHAKMKSSFMEYTAVTNGENYVFLDHGDECYIRIKSDRREKSVCSITIDGNKLGYSIELGTSPSDCGLWSFKSGHSINRAFKFFDRGHDNGRKYGRVEVRFFDSILLNGTSMGLTDVTPTLEGNLQSIQGNKVIVRANKDLKRTKFHKGRLLATIAANYHPVSEASMLIEGDRRIFDAV